MEPAAELPVCPPETIRAIAEEWIGLVAQSCPEGASPPPVLGVDRFRNPAGHILRSGLTTLVEEVLGAMDASRVDTATDSIVRLGAVQDITPAQALSFIPLLRGILRGHLGDCGPALEIAERRLDELGKLAFRRYSECRKKLIEIRANELERSRYLQTRLDRRSAVH
jgi:hypothetical protein